MPAFHVGTRDGACAYEFMSDLAGRLQGRVQLTTDGHSAYLSAVRDAFGRDIARLTNGFSKRSRTTAPRPRSTSASTTSQHPSDHPLHPAMEAGVASRPWTVEEIVGLLEQREHEASEMERRLILK